MEPTAKKQDSSLATHGEAGELQAARTHSREFESVAESSPDNIIRYDLNCRAVYINRMLEKTVNVAAASLLGKTPLESRFDGIVGIENYQAKLQQVIATGGQADVELLAPDPDGNPAPTMSTLPPNAIAAAESSAHWLLVAT
ncbi:MAG: PAS domain-containing protein [Gallionella sp.]|nr:PAS domain-containing protein [Gallionella sp.]